MAWGQYGDIQFINLFSPDFNNGVAFEKEALTHEHPVNGGKGILEVMGVKAETLTIRIRLDATFVDDIDLAIEFFITILENQESEMLMIGDFILGEYYLTKITGVKRYVLGGIRNAEATLELTRNEEEDEL